MDNGVQFTSLALVERAEKHALKPELIQSDKPVQNAFIERFNRIYRTEVPDFYLFIPLNQAQEMTIRIQ